VPTGENGTAVFLVLAAEHAAFARQDLSLNSLRVMSFSIYAQIRFVLRRRWFGYETECSDRYKCEPWKIDVAAFFNP